MSKWKQYDANPFTFQLSQPRPDERAGGIVAADVNNDGLMDYLYTTPGSVGAYDHFGKTLWVKQVDVHLLGADGVVVSGSEVHVYWNPKPHPNPHRPRLWTQNHYRRGKMNWNYYSL